MYKNPNYQKEYREKNKEKLKEYQRRYRKENRERLLRQMSEYGKEWYKKNKTRKAQKGKEWSSKPENKQKRVSYVQKYVSKNKEKVRDYNQSFDQSFSGKYRLVLYRHQKRWTTEPITLDEFKQIVVQTCVYCGDKNTSKGIDRVDNDLGYTVENSKSCCKRCNYMKNNRTVTEFLFHIQKIWNHQSR